MRDHSCLRLAVLQASRQKTPPCSAPKDQEHEQAWVKFGSRIGHNCACWDVLDLHADTRPDPREHLLGASNGDASSAQPPDLHLRHERGMSAIEFRVHGALWMSKSTILRVRILLMHRSGGIRPPPQCYAMHWSLTHFLPDALLLRGGQASSSHPPHACRDSECGLGAAPPSTYVTPAPAGISTSTWRIVLVRTMALQANAR